MPTVRAMLERESFLDAAILRHGFVDYIRDYEIVVGGRDGPPHTDLHRYLFIGCAEAHFETMIKPQTFTRSLDDEFVFTGPDYPDRDEPKGFIWGVRWAPAYPGLEYIENSLRARTWADRLGRPMHEVRVESNAYRITLIFADIRHEHLGREGDGAPVHPKDYPIAITDADRTSDGGVA